MANLSNRNTTNNTTTPTNTNSVQQASDTPLNTLDNLIPLYSVYRNDEPIFITGSIQTAYIERVANEIKMHLEAVTDDEYRLQVVQWIEDKETLTGDMPPRTNPKSFFDTWEGK